MRNYRAVTTAITKPLRRKKTENQQKQGTSETIVQTTGLPGYMLRLQRQYGNRFVQRTLSPSILKIQRFGESGHEKATQQGLQGMFSTEEMKEVQFGNWKTDMNQISLAIPYFEKIGIKLTPSDCVEIVSVLATDKFGEEIGSRVNAASLGVYSEAEHFDNPNKKKEDAQTQPFFNDSITLINKRLHDTVSLGNTPDGRELLGNTLHTVQDIFAHSNFVEIALNLMGKSVDTMGGKTSSGELIMTSGIFGGLDTAISIAKMVADKLKEPAKKSGKLSAGTRIAIIVLNRNGYSSVANMYLKALETVEQGKDALVRVLPDKLQALAGAGIQKLERMFQAVKEEVLNKISNGINAMAQSASKFTGSSSHPSHSRLAKDSSSEPRKLFPIAAILANVATRELGTKVMKIWNLKAKSSNQASIDAELKALDDMVKTYMGHPANTTWWRSFVKP